MAKKPILEEAYQEGLCPMCGEPVEYGALIPDGPFIYYEYTCTNEECNDTGKEWYSVHYEETKSNRD